MKDSRGQQSWGEGEHLSQKDHLKFTIQQNFWKKEKNGEKAVNNKDSVILR